MNAKMSKREIGLLLLYPLYSICHIIKNFPPIRATLKKILPESDKDADKLTVDVVVMTKHGDRPCKLEFISTEAGLARIRFIYKNKKYIINYYLFSIEELSFINLKFPIFTNKTFPNP